MKINILEVKKAFVRGLSAVVRDDELTVNSWADVQQYNVLIEIFPELSRVNCVELRNGSYKVSWQGNTYTGSWGECMRKLKDWIV